MGHPITVLLGVVEPDLEGLLITLLQNVLPGHTALTIRSVRTLPEIEEAATEYRLDLAVLLLNNIITPDSKDRVASALAGVRHLAARGVPVISLYGGIVRPEVAVLALTAGARFHIPIPVAIKRLQDAVQQCLPSLSEAAAGAR